VSFLKVGSEISYLFLHRSHLRGLAIGGKRLSVYFHQSRPDHAVLCIGAAKSKDARFPQTAPTDTALESVDGSQTSSRVDDLQEEDKVIGGAPVWGRPKRLRCLC
jgi:hypothetical protein